MPMQLTVEHLSGSKKGQLEQLEGDRITIGRNPTNALNFDAMVDLDVSGDHAQMAVGDEGKFVLVDLGSKNGTFLNGTKIGSAVPVEPGSKIQFGKNGPEVRIAYAPGAKRPGATRVMLAAVQQQMETERAQAAAGKKTMMIVVGAVAFLAIVGVIITVVLLGISAKREKAETAQTASVKTHKKSDAAKAKSLAAKKYAEANDLEQQAKKQFEAGNYDEARKNFDLAADAFDEATLAAQEEGRRRDLASRDEERERAAERERLAMAEDQRRREQEAKDEMERLKREMEGANAERKRQLDMEYDRRQKTPSSPLAKEIEAANEPSIVHVFVESYVQPKGSNARSVIARAEGSGFAVAKDTIAVAKHIVQPWKYDKTVLATAKKIKEEHGLEVQDYIEIHVGPGGGKPYDKKYDSVAGSCKILKTMVDKKVEKEEVVEIEWNQAKISVPGIKVHEDKINDLALLSVPNGNFKPCELATKRVGKEEPVLILGTVRDKKLVTLSKAGGDPQTITESMFNVSATVPASFSGGAVFGYDKKLYGLVAGTAGQNVICLPIEQVVALQGQGGESAGPGGGSSNVAGGQDPGKGGPGPGGTPPDDEPK